MTRALSRTTSPSKPSPPATRQNDSGVFELSFRDERYLPFEGAGAISEWSLELFSDLPSNNPIREPDFGKPLRQFDYSTISDAILHVKYTAREDAGAFKNGAIAHLRDYFSQDGATPSLRMFNLRQEFPTPVAPFLASDQSGRREHLRVGDVAESLPHREMQEKTLKVNTIWLLARCTDAGNYSVELTLIPPAPSPPLSPQTFTLERMNEYGGLRLSQKDISAQPIEVVQADPPTKWQIKMTGPSGNLNPDPAEVEDLMLVLGYAWE